MRTRSVFATAALAATAVLGGATAASADAAAIGLGTAAPGDLAGDAVSNTADEAVHKAVPVAVDSLAASGLAEHTGGAGDAATGLAGGLNGTNE
ncbi:hypothetical protein [Streptomyces sp. NPDC051684]|uniref:hypothetical protein n=1 Tax=Streptomyces sp. NPDC051684 TaxID=3365670 RepID=UPI0037B00951